jgi:hypothetical protein
MKTHAKDRWWTVPRDWDGETCFIVAGGYSLVGFDPDEIRGLGRVIVINTSYRLMTDADVLYFVDTCWWQEHRVEYSRTFLGRVISMGNPRLEQVRSLKEGPQLGLSKDPGILCHGSNGGYSSINLAYLLGAKRIVLLGYDMRLGPNGETHWHGGHGRERNYARRLQKWIRCLKSLVKPLAAEGVEVLNCTPESALPWWPKPRLSAVIQEERLKKARRARIAVPLTRQGGLLFLDKKQATAALKMRLWDA